MADEIEFITRLIGFGLSEKEAQLYLHLLKYGPKQPSLLAKSLKTYREDAYRTLTGLMDKGMVSPSLETPTVYAAVELDIALDTALKKHETELREMERRKLEIQELAQQQRFRPSDDVTTFKIISNMKELVSLSLDSVALIKEELLFVIPSRGIAFMPLSGMTGAAKQLIMRGGNVRGIADISCAEIELIQELLDSGADIRYLDQYHGLYFAVSDRKTCFSVINADIRRVSLTEPITVLWTGGPTYAEYLVSTFELLWKQAVPAAQRIEELLKEGLPQA